MSLFASLQPLLRSRILTTIEKPHKLQHLNDEFWQSRAWDRYVSGDYMSELTDVVRANTLLSWTKDSWSALDAVDVQKWLSDVVKVYSALEETKKLMLNAWVQIAIKCLLRSEKLQDVLYHAENISFFYYQQSPQRSAKMMFFSGLQIEIAPSLQNICITAEEQVDLSQVKDVLCKYSPGSVFEGPPTKQKDVSSAANVESLTLGDVILAKKTTKKFGAKRNAVAKHQKAIAANTVEPVQRVRQEKLSSKKKKSLRCQSKSLPKMIKTVTNKNEKKEEKPVASLLSEVATLWQPPVEKVDENSSTETEVDFDQEGFLGRVFHLRCYETSTRPQLNGEWMQRIDSGLEEKSSLDEQLALNIGLKVPVEEVFVGTTEPAVAFFDDQSGTWIKDVHTTHAQYDINTSIVNIQISKFGKIALFQRTDFHLPYRKWSLDTSSSNVSLTISTNFAELTFLFHQLTISVDIGSNTEFSKLKLINRKQFSLPEMARRLLGYGIFIFPSEKVLHKQFGNQIKNEELEEYVCRYVCTNGISCCSNKLNASVPQDTVVIGVGETSV
ncbi:hypothetical protein Tcan_17363 [Toxocara canis]|uniref:Uncharacterized protein n=1 Tax=Toxocara canis TaxID=6265 RepID=A0A0B2UPM5_TOXCA|nr:hypothetical protein Tcan_17363 [Toxocara canis]